MLIGLQKKTDTQLKLELAGAEPVSGSAPGAFVEALFDQYAEKFDHALVETLVTAKKVLLESETAKGVAYHAPMTTR